ncbi:MAG TPA: hypothetical protein ACFYD4_07575 [Candidatus Wunengus sp. YC61]|uniref:hypothetical protein n=1 Tax=Candidatus Wunengus sp. YC61 TaxID=3367698 RepID=UPI004027CD32
MAQEIDMHFIGQVAVFSNKGGGPDSDGIVPVVVTEHDGGCIEVAFDSHAGKKRTYLRFNRLDLDRAVEAFDEE